jgi:hypothetical protein
MSLFAGVLYQILWQEMSFDQRIGYTAIASVIQMRKHRNCPKQTKPIFTSKSLN